MNSNIEYITLNITSAGWITAHTLEYFPQAVTVVVGISILTLNIVKIISLLKKNKKD